MPHKTRSRFPIAPSVLLCIIFLGLQFVIYVVITVTGPLSTWEALYVGPGPLTTTSIVITVLLLLYLGVDFWTQCLEGRGRDRFQVVAFAAATIVMLALLSFFVRAVLWTG